MFFTTSRIKCFDCFLLHVFYVSDKAQTLFMRDATSCEEFLPGTLITRRWVFGIFFGLELTHGTNWTRLIDVKSNLRNLYPIRLTEVDPIFRFWEPHGGLYVLPPPPKMRN